MKHDLLSDFLSKFVIFSEEELQIITTKFVTETIAKNELFLKEGDVCKKVAFVVKGTFKLSQTLENGNEQILDFFTDSNIVSDYYSFVKNTPSTTNIKAVKDATILVINKENLEYLYKSIPNYERLGRLLAEKHFIHLAEKIKNSALPPIKRYENFMNRRPEVFEKFPQYMIASYLGIRPEWLSKIRAKK